MDITEAKFPDIASFPCKGCGASLKYKPGTTQLVCEYCGTTNEIAQEVSAPIEELDYEKQLSQQPDVQDQITITAVKCQGCGAMSSVDPKITATLCPYCATPLVVVNASKESMIKPKSLLPFGLDLPAAQREFKKWIDKLWFAPSDLQKAVLQTDHFKGVYLPFWTFDSQTNTDYSGQQGIYYYTTEHYTATENGKSVSKTRQVKNTRWTFVSGSVNHFFDDVLICASNSVPRNYVTKLEPWDLQNLVAFNEKFLSGFICEKYQVTLPQGFDLAREVMAGRIEQLVRSNIGGDEQRITSSHTRHSDITFKHVLLPVYISAFRFKGKVFRFLVNARTGEVQGERPWSAAKIALAIIFGLVIIWIIYSLAN